MQDFLKHPATNPSAPRAKATEPSTVRVDLGCGASKQDGFVGIDRFVLPGVDIVCNLDRGIPLATDSADHLLASHSLEHLRDLPAAIAEIFRVCRDRALVTIVAPYDATRLNRANPYHLQNWNEHTARFFTVHDSPAIDAANYRFPAAEHWGLLASDFTRSDVDLRCLRMEFSYFPPYRALDEETKRTLRQSLTDVCDQMALHLLVVKSPISNAELREHAKNIQHRFPVAFEARRRADADIGAPNLFAELAQIPARLAALSSMTKDGTVALGQEIASLGNEVRRFIERVDHVDRALVAEKDDTARSLRDLAEASRALGERLTVINSALTRQIQGTAGELHDSVSAQLHRTLGKEVADARTAMSSKSDEVRNALAEQLRVRTKELEARSLEPIMAHLVAERRGRADFAFRPIRFLRRYRQRGLDMRAVIGSELARLWAGPETPPDGFKLQLGTFLVPGQTRTYTLPAAGSPLCGIELGATAMFAPPEPTAVAEFELCDAQHKVLRTGTMTLDETCRGRPTAIDFEPPAIDAKGPLIFKLTPNATVDRFGIQLLEWHRVGRVMRRVSEQRLAYRGRH